MFSELFNMERILGFCEKLCYFLAVNILFLVSSLPVLLFFLFVGISHVREYLPFFLLCMASVPPAFSAVLYAMRRLLDGRERGAWRDYWKGYRTDFFQKFRLGCAHMLVLFILWTNVEFFSREFANMPLMIFFTLLFAAAVLISPNLYLLASRYEMENVAIAKTACILTITRPVCTLGMAAALGAVLAAFEIAAGTAVLFMISVYAFLVVFISKGVLKTLEENTCK